MFSWLDAKTFIGYGKHKSTSLFVAKTETGGKSHPIYLKWNLQGPLQWIPLSPSRELSALLLDTFHSPQDCYPIAKDIKKLFSSLAEKKKKSQIKVSNHAYKDLFYTSQLKRVGVGVEENAGIRQLEKWSRLFTLCGRLSNIRDVQS